MAGYYGGLSILGLLFPLLGGCAIHPLPEDVTGYNTYDIVHQIRCEARKAVKERAVAALAASKDPGTRKFAPLLDEDLGLFKRESYAGLDPETRRLFMKYDGSAISYDFTFTMTENNDVSTDINFLRPLLRGSEALGFKAGNNRERQNIRNFRIADTFVGLLHGTLKCEGKIRDPNYVYPITGQVGLAEVIWTFLDLNEVHNLASRDPAAKDKVPVLSDTLRFTTTFSGSATPKVVLSPVGRRFSLADAAFTAEAKRSDIHTLVVSLSLPVSDPTDVPLPATVRTTARRATAVERASQENDYQIDKNRLVPLTTGRGVNLVVE